MSHFASQFPPDSRFLYISITESVKPHRQRFSYKPGRGKEKFKEAFFPRRLPFLASLVLVILRIVVAWIQSRLVIRCTVLFTKDSETRDSKIADGNLQCWFKFWIKGFESSYEIVQHSSDWNILEHEIHPGVNLINLFISLPKISDWVYVFGFCSHLRIYPRQSDVKPSIFHYKNNKNQQYILYLFIY